MALPEGIVVVVKRDCPTCTLIAPVIGQLADRLGPSLTVFSQDDPSFPDTVPAVVDDRSLETSWRLGVSTVPTMLKVTAGREEERTEGWERGRWEAFTGVSGLGAGLPATSRGAGRAHSTPASATSCWCASAPAA
jgi:hypothetical protein